ncbi:MAG: bifunctional UDP-N-acetylglucosamine diphosphorylase/glucosamine-1-phosphate N-acetyltransferase GlmU [Firmicutes bacterium]|jgi:bifunctional UDP-N-acetylglucosamine pyrophosphorylase/glucosamine-1-phosphate N-acetyltransferase|nr:bifunctional UDP-N-acetylglucosamine diphosphorylase/glucosamine-1-phosphate N-acetyltransferase GlmU [Bacillota bacterium]
MRNVAAIVLAAGLGKRMKSSLVKTLHLLRGKPIITYAVNAAKDLRPARLVVVVGHQGEDVMRAIGPGVEYAVQAEQRGTGHAVLQAAPLLQDFRGDVVILYGDMPLLTARVIERLLDEHSTGGFAATVLTAVLDDPSGYGRIVRDERGGFRQIVEDGDCTPEEREIREINTGVYCFKARLLFEALKRIRPENSQGEFYLTDVLGLLRGDGMEIGVVAAEDVTSVMGINDRRQLAWAEGVLRERKMDKLMLSGVTVLDPRTTYIDEDVEIGPDTLVKPFTFLEGRTTLGSGCIVGPSTRISDSVLRDGVSVEFSVVEGSTIETGVRVGPFSHLRPGTTLGPGVRVGNFAEIKNSRIGAGSKIPHHSYVGDSDIGERVNLGAGCVTVNYDGWRKHRTVVEDEAFVGCNVNIIAPLKVGEGAYVAAGSTINADVPAGALAIARARQENKEGWARKKAREQRGGSKG